MTFHHFDERTKETMHTGDSIVINWDNEQAQSTTAARRQMNGPLKTYSKTLVMVATMGILMLSSGLLSHVRHGTSPIRLQGGEANVSSGLEISLEPPHSQKADEKHALTRQLSSRSLGELGLGSIKMVTIRSYSSSNYLDGRGPGDAGINKVHLTNRDPDGDKYLQWLFIPVGNGDKVAIRSVSSGLYMAGRDPDQTGPQVNLRNADINDIYVQWEIIRYGNTYAIRSMSSRNYLDGRNPNHTGAQLYLTNRNPSGDRYLKWIITEIEHQDEVIESAEFNHMWASSPNQILRRKCRDCKDSHKDIYYRRFDANGLPDGFDLLDTVKNNWYSNPRITGNTFNVDFKLYSTYGDALTDRNEWKYCNFNDPTVGFPRDCSPVSFTGWQWNSFVKGGAQGNIGFYIESEKSLPKPQSPKDKGYSNRLRGWYDAQGTGKNLDYGRYVGGPGPIWWSVALAGRTDQHTAEGEYEVPDPSLLQSEYDIIDKWDAWVPFANKGNLALKPLVDYGAHPIYSGVQYGLCEGDCDNDSQCAAGLTCFQRDGTTPVPGCAGVGVSNHDYCIYPSLQDHKDSGDEKPLVDHGADPIFSGVQYGLCEGDCDNDSQCKAGLTCFQRDGTKPVPGCAGVGVSNHDYCIDPSLQDHKDSGDENEPFGICEGYCDDDSQCEEGLVCFRRNRLENVPRCNGEGVSDQGYCTYPHTYYHEGRDVEEDGPFGRCEGDCGSDDDCVKGQVCFQRNEFESVPGCYGRGVQNSNYCTDPSIKYFGQHGHEKGVLGICEGDCDVDSHCSEGLACFQRSGFASIPGCFGRGVYDDDYCVYPSIRDSGLQTGINFRIKNPSTGKVFEMLDNNNLVVREENESSTSQLFYYGDSGNIFSHDKQWLMLDSDPACEKLTMKWLTRDDNLDIKRFHFMPDGSLQSLQCEGKVVGSLSEDGTNILLKVNESKSDQKWELLSKNQNLVSFYIISNDEKVIGMNDQGELEYSLDREEDRLSKLFFYGPDNQFVNAKYQRVLQEDLLPDSFRLDNIHQVVSFHIKQHGNINNALDVKPDGSVTLEHFDETAMSQKFFYSAKSKRIVNAKYFKVFGIAHDKRIILSPPDIDDEVQEFEMSGSGEIYGLYFNDKVVDIDNNGDIIVADRDANRLEQKWSLSYGSDMTLLVGTNDGMIAAKFIGSYGSEKGDGTFAQDHNNGLENDNIHVESNNRATLFGNAWKAFQLEPSYSIRRDTMLRFSFGVEEEAEGHAICLEDDLSEDSFSGRSRRCISLAGTQIDKWNYVFNGNQFSSGDSVSNTYAVPVGRIFDNLINVKYIAFIQDNDLEANTGHSTFADISLADDYDGPEDGNQCPEGFISLATGGEFLQGPHDSCVSSLFSDNIKITSSSIQFWSFTINSISDKVLSRRVDPDNEIKRIDLSDHRKYSESVIKIDDTTAYSYNFTDLKPGVRYEVSFSYVNGAQNETMVFPAVTSCSCGSEAIDRTGRPENLQIQQEGGHVMFSFIDNSVCEEAFSFTRSDYVEEFLSDVSEYGVSFTRDYYFNGGRACGGKIEPKTEASDNLIYSKLEVGKMYSYCARAVRTRRYMDHPFDDNINGRTLTSSDDTCASHRVRWEASVQGRITTEPNAGSLPIKNVTVVWELLNDDLSSIDACEECSGVALTKDSGKFEISLNVDNPSLRNKNDVDFPVRFSFSKVSGSGDTAIDHRFLCNNGEDDCSGDTGTIKYLSHLQFSEQLDVYDDTSVPYSGRVIISDTGIGNPCTIANAKVCLVQYRSSGGVNGVKDYLVCGNTDSNGEYSLPVIMGSRVDAVEIDYHEHDFVPTPDSKFVSGEVIEETAYYGDRDFQDQTKARLDVEVAGGLCNKYLGISTIQVRIVGCEWKGLEITQEVVKGTYNNVPGHLLEIQVTDVKDDDGRIQPIFTHFQGQQPETRIIDLTNAGASDQAVNSAGDSIRPQGMKTGTEDKKILEGEVENMDEILKEEEEDLELVRFEYVGELKLDVFIDGKNLGCSNYSLSDYGADSLHLLDKFEIFEVRVMPKYEILSGVYCDIVDDNLKIIMENQVGLGDPNFPLSDEDKRQIDSLTNTEKQILEYCQNGCQFGFEHDTDEETGEILGNARYNTFLGTGQPNIVEPYAKYINFRVENKQHKAAVVIQGDYSKGPGRSFALPSSKPIMILRDPPGGLSYATYENVKTTLKLRTNHQLTVVKNNFGYSAKQNFGTKAELCGGGGFGVLVLACKVPFEGKSKMRLSERSQSIGGITEHEEENQSNQFTTTWSYRTSSDPWLAGAMSDVFVVPNLNVEFQEVMEVRWDSGSCSVFEEEDSQNNPPLPVQTVFDLSSPTRKEALAFYSRYHVQYSKLPDLYRSIGNIEKSMGKCKCGTVDEIADTDCNCGSFEQQIKTLRDAVADWSAVLKESEDAVTTSSRANSMINWFDKVGPANMHTDNDVAIKDQPSSLLPPGLSRSAGDKNTERIQFSGGGNMFSMQMKKEKAESVLTKANWNGKSIQSETKLRGPGLVSTDIKAFNNGYDFAFNLFDLTVHHEHDSTKKTDKSDETVIGFVLGDSDPGDEFVLDLYYDEEYGSIIFKTVSGVSNCPHEDGTIAFAVPDIKVTRYAPSIVFPDDAMEFEVELVNQGVGNSTRFHMFSRQINNQDGVLVQAAGGSLAFAREFDYMESGVPYRKRITVKKDSGLYKNKAVEVVFENACQDNDSVINDLTASIFKNSKSSSSSVTLYNTVEGEGENIEKFLTFVHPCDKVYWAGELNRDRGFVVNTNSDAQDHLLVTAFNPSYSDKKFCNMKSDRLENIHLSYRREGDVHWKAAITEVDNDDGSKSLVELDFSDDCDDEDDYGYISKKWRLGNAVPEGNYEIRLGSQCDKLGGPDDIDRYDTPILSGVIDLTRPEQYGRPLPLRDQVLIGEEISVVFTEDLDCAKPYSFGMKVEIEGTDYSFDREELQVTCEGRKIGFQIDPTVGIDLNRVMGKVVKVEIGNIDPNSELNVFDVNGNSIDPNKGSIKFEKTLASLNLDQAATSFHITVDESNCTDALVGSYSDELKSKIASILDIETTRIEINGVDCVKENIVTAVVGILPNDNDNGNGGRRLRSSPSSTSSGDHAADLFYTLRDISLQKLDASTRKLANDKMRDAVDAKGHDSNSGFDFDWAFSISGLKILPCSADLEKVRTDPAFVDEEKELKKWSMSQQTSLENRASSRGDDQDLVDVDADAAQFQRIANMQSLILEQGQMLKVQEEKYEREMKSLILEREEKYEHEMKTMLKELTAVTIVCIGLGMTVFLHIWRK